MVQSIRRGAAVSASDLPSPLRKANLMALPVVSHHGADPGVLRRIQIASMEGPGVIAPEMMIALKDEHLDIGPPHSESPGDQAVGQPPSSKYQIRFNQWVLACPSA